MAGGWKSQSLESLAEAEVAPCTDPANERIRYTVDDIALCRNTILSLGCALHQLAINTANYDA